MKHIKLYENFFSENFEYSRADKEKEIKYLKKLPSELKEVAMDHIQYITHAKNGIVTGLSLHSDLIKKIKTGGYPDGFSMGIDNNGYFIHTHRARSKSHQKPEDVTAKEMKFIDSTG